MAKVATDFEKIIKEGRDRKKNELLAQRIFSKDRRQSVPTKAKPGAGPSLASRVGVKKRVASLGPKPNLPAGNVDGEWTHDLHSTVNSRGGAGGLASRISAPGSKRAPQQRAVRVAAAFERTEAQPQVSQPAPVAVFSPAPPLTRGLSIRGLAGPYAVMAQNFAPGTTAADIESAMTPVGGEMVSCTIIKTSPILVAEMLFASKEGGEQVISTFNNQTADGRIIKVYPKPGAYNTPTIIQRNQAPVNAPNGPRAQRGDTRATTTQVVDGSHGFTDLMDTDTTASNTNGTLYSDKLVGNNRRGRGFQRGRGGR